jgi:hypothetical protein
MVELEDRQVPAVLCWVATDRPALGGKHKVVAYGRLAREVEAFVQAANGEQLQATVNGWLRSQGEAYSVVIADRISFHTADEVRERAKRRLT